MNKKSRRNLFLLAGLVALLLIISGIFLLLFNPESNPKSSTTPTPMISASDSKPYTNNEYGFSINYPSDWTIEDIENATTHEVVGFRDKDKQVSLIIKVEKLGKKAITLDSYIDENVKLFLQKATIKERNTEVTLSGFSRAYRLVYTQEDEAGNIKKTLETGGINGENKKEEYRGYVILYEADEDKFSQFEPYAEMMINSFKLIK